jgi:hypothetical protein
VQCSLWYDAPNELVAGGLVTEETFRANFGLINKLLLLHLVGSLYIPHVQLDDVNC